MRARWCWYWGARYASFVMGTSATTRSPSRTASSFRPRYASATPSARWLGMFSGVASSCSSTAFLASSAYVRHTALASPFRAEAWARQRAQTPRSSSKALGVRRRSSSRCSASRTQTRSRVPATWATSAAGSTAPGAFPARPWRREVPLGEPGHRRELEESQVGGREGQSATESGPGLRVAPHPQQRQREPTVAQKGPWVGAFDLPQEIDPLFPAPDACLGHRGRRDGASAFPGDSRCASRYCSRARRGSSAIRR